MIVQNILNYVEEQDISINDFAKKCKLRPTTIYSIINGQSRSPTLSVVQKIANGMDMTIDELTKTTDTQTLRYNAYMMRCRGLTSGKKS